jgi:uncharacterized membrane protein YdbT with pleckstrin-like domain
MSGQWWFQRDDETIVWEGSPRLSAAIAGVGLGFVLITSSIVAAIAVDVRAAVATLLGIGLAGWQLLRVRQTSYLITSRAIWSKRGVVGQTVRRVGLSQVQNTAYSKSLTGSFFGYGTVTVEVAGGQDVDFRRIDDPESVRRMITERINEASSELPGTADQWRAVLSVVQDINEAVN